MSRPNIVYVFADDLGYGDVACNNPDGRIPTPNLDRLAERGIRMTDMHATSALCTPSRYSLLTGHYAWRSRLESGIVWPWDGALIEPDRLTVGDTLRDAGYRTACLGKWHLGWEWSTLDGTHPNETLPFGGYCDNERAEFEARIDFDKPIGGGPVDCGFDSYFGVDVPNFTPYTWFEDDHVTEVPTEPKPDHLYGHAGRAVPGWRHEDMIPEFTRRAVTMIEEAAEPEAQPLFLYYALTSPHSPIVPNEPFAGQSGIGPYGDFVCEVDWLIGELVDALERAGQTDNTLLVFTSDNGPELEVGDDEGAYEWAERTRHFSMGELRGVKRDSWEGGHRVPFIATWPDVIDAAGECHQTSSLVDLMATVADILNTDLPPDTAEDSVSLLPLLKGEAKYDRTSLVHHGGYKTYAIRQGDWVLIDGPSGGLRPEPDWFSRERGYEPHEAEGELFNLAEDLPQRVNRYVERPDLVNAMRAELRKIHQET